MELLLPLQIRDMRIDYCKGEMRDHLPFFIGAPDRTHSRGVSPLQARQGELLAGRQGVYPL